MDIFPWWFELIVMPCVIILLIISVIRVVDHRDLQCWMFPLAVLLGSILAWLGGVPPRIANALAASLLGVSVIATVLTWIAAGKRVTEATQGSNDTPQDR